MGTFGAGVLLIVEGLHRSNNVLAALGVLCVLATLIASSAGAWKLSGPGFDLEKSPPPAEVRQLPRADQGDGPQGPLPDQSSERAPPFE
jgi:hypothetical protein